MARFKRHEIPENSGINLAPLMDVIFQLLVFFVLTSSLVRPTQIELQLPESSTGVKSSDQQGLVITCRIVEDQPAITFNGEAVAGMEPLVTILRESRGDGAQPRMDIQIDRAVPYQEVVRLMDAARDTGYPKFSLLTLAPARDASR